MGTQENPINRRNFLKGIGAVGVGSVFSPDSTKAKQNEKKTIDPNAVKKEEKPKIPLRKFGKTGIKVPILSLGMMFNAVEKQIVLRKAIQLGVTYWDTAYSYSGGNSELGVGKFLSKNPAMRKKLFLASKASETKTIADVENRLQESLKRMETKYIDLYYLHSLTDTSRLTRELAEWAVSAKKRKLIRYFGFTTHKNMTELLEYAAKLKWVDAIMHSYNFRLMQDAKLSTAMDVCHKASIALIAMKTQGQKVKKIETEEDRKMVSHFLSRGFTEGQAKIKAVLQDKRITAACVGRDNIAHLILNVAAVQDKTKLKAGDIKVLAEYAQATCTGYCAGCANICESLLPADMCYVSDIMRYLMYYNCYGETDNARGKFAKIPTKVRAKLLITDYSLAEARCPQRLEIGRLMVEAVSKLA